MGSGVSAQEGLKEEVVITENEIGEMYAHLTTEYDKKIKEILSRRSISLDENDQDRASQSTPVSVNLATDTEHGEEEEEDESTEAAAAKAHFNRGITIAELNEKLAARALTENPGFLPNGPLSVKVLNMLGDTKLEIESKRTLPAGAKVTPKVMKKLGEKDFAAPKAKSMIGEDMTRKQKADMVAAQEKEEEIEKQAKLATMNEALKRRPTEKEKAIHAQVEPKALMIIGDTELEAQSRRKFIRKTRTLTSKSMRMLGDLDLLPEKAGRSLGESMSEDQIKRMRKAELLESKRVLDMKLKSMNKVLKAKPDEKQKEIPADAQINKKVLVLAGDDCLLPPKAKKRLGSAMGSTLRRLMMRSEKQPKE